MGGQIFFDFSVGASAQSAFDEAVEEACYEYGHGGYTGTIAEKSEFRMLSVSLPEGAGDLGIKDFLLDYPPAQTFFDNKWGPAGCIELGDGKYLFFGMASS